MSDKDKVWILEGGIIGTSKFIGQHHLAAARSIISPRVDVNFCVPGSPENFEINKEGARQMGFSMLRTYGTVSAMLEQERVESGRPRFVIIATPNHLHAEDCIRAAEAGYDIISGYT